MVEQVTLDQLERFASERLALSAAALNSVSPAQIASVIISIQNTRDRGATIWTCGNGGSAAIAAHFALDLSHNTSRNNRPVRAITLSADANVATALANDHGYSSVFSKQVEHLGRRGDLLVAISTSGASPNVVAAAQSARRCGLDVIALVGTTECPLAAYADYVVCLGSSDPAVAEDAALCAAHTIYAWFERGSK